MATRSLTKKFEGLRANFKKKREEQLSRRRPGRYSADGPLLPSEDAEDSQRLATVAGLVNGLPPQWVDIVENIHKDIKDIKDKVSTLQQLHNDRLRISFGGGEKEKERDIEVLTGDITHLIRKCDNNIKRIALVGNDSGKLSKEEANVRLNVMRNLGATVHDISKQFRACQKDYFLRLKGQKEAGSTFFPEDDESSTVTEEEAMERGFTPQQMQQLKELKTRASDRDKEIVQIAESINDLAAIFKELNVLVIEQGTVLDRIDYNVEQTLVKVKEGVQQIRVADDYSKKMRTLKCIIALIVLIIILIGILIWKHSK